MRFKPAAREDRGSATSIRVSAETRSELIYLLHRAQSISGSREHERGGRQYGTAAVLTVDDVVYELLFWAANQRSDEAEFVAQLVELVHARELGRARQFLTRRIPDYPHTGGPL